MSPSCQGRIFKSSMGYGVWLGLVGRLQRVSCCRHHYPLGSEVAPSLQERAGPEICCPATTAHTLLFSLDSRTLAEHVMVVGATTFWLLSSKPFLYLHVLDTVNLLENSERFLKAGEITDLTLAHSRHSNICSTNKQGNE